MNSPDIYYYANQFYQYSNALPLYNHIGGTFISKDRFSRRTGYVKNLRNLNQTAGHKTLFNTPPLIFKNIEEDLAIEGLFFVQSNQKFTSSKKLFTVFVGHGVGDKKYEEDVNYLKRHDFHFITGPKQMEKYRDQKIEIPAEKLIQIGNLRFDDYINNKIDKDKIFAEYGFKDRGKKVVLYAPTWRYGSGTFKTHVKKIITELSDQYNLIVRPHYHNAHYIPRVKLWAKLNGYSNLYFSNPGKLYKNDTMFDFAISDLLISDTSSILYEYLVTGKPIIVVQNDFDDYHSMPDEMNIMTAVDIYDGNKSFQAMIEENLQEQKYADTYKKMLHSCFYFNDGKSVDRAVKFINEL